ncbi:patatin-like phospholipase domain-containing protein [Sinorhizobium chiapasense]|uniref:Patatin-like phospholipase n=1 Tax=Sinorhizobium chiapasense TaxID=501572 RepID=A0ABZ2BK01_9HYPH
MKDKESEKLPWRTALSRWEGQNLLFDDHFFEAYGDRVWDVKTSELGAAHALHIELVSRVATHPLGYNEGSEERALESVFSLFAVARELTRSAPEAPTFETIVWHVLNTFVRPFTAKWHVRAKTGELRALDSSDIFRAELVDLQRRLIALDDVLAKITESECYSVPVTGRPADAAVMREMTKPVSWKPMGEPSSVAVARPRTQDEATRLEKLKTAEAAFIKERRTFYGIGDNDWASGIALSGGGIRSATFAMGVLVSLSKRNLLTQFDYLSSVSGGGYISSFLTQLLGSPPDEKSALTLRSSDLPFKREEGESLLLQRIRHGASFLSAGPWERFAVAMAQAQGIFINVLMCVLLISILAYIQILLNYALTPDRRASVALAFIIAFFAWALVLPVSRTFGHQWLNLFNKINAWVCALLLVPPIWAGLQAANAVATLLREWLVPDETRLTGFAFVFFLIFGAVFSIAAALFIGFSRIRPLLMTGLTVVFVFLCEGFAFQVFSGLDEITALKVMISLLAVGLVLFVLFNANSTSLHHYYRTKLLQAFLLDKHAQPTLPIKLSAFSAPRAMFPIINCALNVPGSKMPEMRGRHADLFSFTPVSAGANLIGHFPIADWESKNPQLDLATAMALSGAAVSPQMGLRTSRYGSFWLTVMNIRLNLWLRRPSIGGTLRRYPNLWNLQKELLASASENGAFVNISDGGHIENLGVYELLRRRCRFIVAIDGENDSQMTFHALTNLQRLAYIDHGIVIEANLEDLRLSEKGLSRSHFRFCRIRYPAGSGDQHEQIGYMIYLKLSLTGNEGEFIRRYKFDEPAFPHHPTANQFFTEVQFEAYRALGEHVGDKMFLPAITGLADTSDVLLENWFYGLGKSFLDQSPG